MNVVREIQRINEREISNGNWSDDASWHAQYKNSAWIFAGGLDYGLTEGDIVCIFSQYGEIMHIILVRDRKTGKSKGYAFLQYEDQRSTILAVDNLNGATVLGRTIRVDHSYGPKKHKKEGEEDSEEEGPLMNVAPEYVEGNVFLFLFTFCNN
ncbi:Putative RNA binding motif protein X-linked 2 [Rhizopus microsporus]|nr:Putative RNA binding motif protein X-linked 2 [Rhizopus microsporus]